MKSSRFYLIPNLLLILLLSGCAAGIASLRNVPQFTVEGRNYYSLVSLCNNLNVNFAYDSFLKRATLERNGRVAVLSPTLNMVSLNGLEKKINNPMILASGVFMVSYELVGIINDFFSGSAITGLKCLKIKKIVVDPGHGGKDPGAVSRNGLYEKDVNLNIALKVASILKEKGYQVLLTRNSDDFLSLEKRAQITNDFGADLFISIHANANNAKYLKGFEVYYLSTDSDDEGRLIAAAENVGLSDSAFDAADRDLKLILGDMIYSANRQDSIDIANSICDALSSKMQLKILRVKGAPFYVLKYTRSPAILIETGYLSNAQEEKLLSENNYCLRISEAIALGVDNYNRRITFERPQ